jgi:hypothetical protein
MRPASLLLLLVLAKIAALAGHRVVFNQWSPVAYFWHDAAMAALAGALELLLARRPRFAWAAYGTLALYIAINIPVMRILSTPMTRTMWRAARGPLADSMRLYVTWGNALLFLAALAVAAFAPLLLRRVRVWPLVAACVAVAALGPAAERRVETFGLGRNAWTALLTP